MSMQVPPGDEDPVQGDGGQSGRRLAEVGQGDCPKTDPGVSQPDARPELFDGSGGFSGWDGTCRDTEPLHAVSEHATFCTHARAILMAFASRLPDRSDPTGMWAS